MMRKVAMEYDGSLVDYSMTMRMAVWWIKYVERIAVVNHCLSGIAKPKSKRPSPRVRRVGVACKQTALPFP